MNAAGQLPDFVTGPYIDGLIEVTRLEGARAVEQLPHRSNDAATHKIRKDQSDDRGKRRHDRRGQYRLSLFRPDGCGGTIAHPQHLGANSLDLLIVFVA